MPLKPPSGRFDRNSVQADSLIVRLPDDPRQRWELMKLCEREVGNETIRKLDLRKE